MKKRLAALLCALVLLTASALPAAALEGETLRTADTLRTLGLIDGTASGGYALNDPATRGQAAVLLVRLAGGESAAAKDPWLAGFRDLDTWCADAVNYAAHQGWVQGVSVLDFRPSAAVTADEWCTWLLRMLGYRDSDGDFAAGEAALFAQHIEDQSLGKGQLETAEMTAEQPGHVLGYPQVGHQYVNGTVHRRVLLSARRRINLYAIKAYRVPASASILAGKGSRNVYTFSYKLR